MLPLTKLIFKETDGKLFKDYLTDKRLNLKNALDSMSTHNLGERVREKCGKYAFLIVEKIWKFFPKTIFMAIIMIQEEKFA